MSLIDTVSDRCLRVAVARWPSEIRDEMARVWAAELYEIRNDGSPPPKRAWTQLRFAFSLAASPPVEDPNRIPKGWRELMPRLGLTLRRCLMLVGVGLLFLIVTRTLEIVSNAWTELLPDPTKAPDAITGATTLLGTVLGIVGALWLGHRLGRDMPLRVRHGRRFEVLASAALVVVCLLGGMTLLRFMGGFRGFPRDVGLVVGGAVLLLVAVIAFAQAARGRARRGLWWGVGTGLVFLELVSIPWGAWLTYSGINSQYSPYAGADVAYFDLPDSLLWFPQSLIWDGVAPGGLAAETELLVMSGLSEIIPVLLTAGAFSLMYLIRSAATEPVEARSKTTSAHTAPAVSARRRHIGLSATGAGVLIWAAGVAFTTPIGDRLTSVTYQEPGLWARESRHWAILLACLGLAWALSGRRRVFLPSVAFGLALLAGDAIVDRADFTGFGVFLVTAGIGGTLAVAAWWVPTKLDKAAPDATTVRRTGVAIAALAAYSAPAALSPSNLRSAFEAVGGGSDPVSLAVAATALSIAFAVVAGVAACASRDRDVSRNSAFAIIGVPVAIMAALGVGFRLGFPVPGIIVTAALCVPMTIYMMAVVCWDRRERSPKDVLRWIGGGLGVTIVGVLALYPQYLTGGLVGRAMLDLQGPGLSANGFITFAGLFAGAVVYAIVVTLITVRGSRREVVATTSGGQVSGEVARA